MDKGLSNRPLSAGSTGSHSTDVLSGVPQGMVLGRLFFPVYINDLPEFVSSEVRIFADDCLLYQQISSQEDAITLHDDLTHLPIWETKWQMAFSPTKC